MKITIDTKEDSPEEIKKVVEFLSQFTEGKIMSNKELPEQEINPEEVLKNLSLSESKEKKKFEDLEEDENPEIEVY